MNLPESSIGLVINDLETEGKFSKIYSWQLDEPKLKETNEPFNKSMNDWFHISSLVSFKFINYFNFYD